MTSLPRSEASLYANKAGQQLLEPKKEAKSVSSHKDAKESFWQELQKASQYERPTKAKSNAASPQPSKALAKDQPLKNSAVQAPPKASPSSEVERKLGKKAQAPTTQAARQDPSQENSAVATPVRPKSEANAQRDTKASTTPEGTSSEIRSEGDSRRGESLSQKASHAPSLDKEPGVDQAALSPIQTSLEEGFIGLTSTPSLETMIPSKLHCILSPEASVAEGLLLAAAPMDGAKGPAEAPLLGNLQTLNFELGGRDVLVQTSPALALLTGQLQRIVPSQMPELLASSQLMQNMLATADLAQLFHQAIPLDAALKSLGLGQNPLASMVQAQGMGDQMTSLHETLNALGFDVERIKQEGTLLQQTLPLEGLQPYMLRSAKLRAQSSQDEIDQGLAAVAAGVLPQAALPDLKLAKAQDSLELSLGSVDKIGVSSERSNSAAGLESLGLMPSESSEFSLPLLAQVFAAPEKTLDPTTSFASEPLPLAREQAPLPELSLLDSFGREIVLPQVQLAASDPFAAMGEQLSQLDPRAFTLTQLESREQADPEQVQIEDIRQLFAPSWAQGDMIDSQASQTSMPEVSFDSLQGPDLASLSIPEGVGDDLGSSAGDQNRREFSSSQGGAGETFTGLGATMPSKETTSAFTLQNSPAPAAPTPSKEFVQNVFDKASMMLKEGGGSIRLDLGSESLGSLDLALDIKDKTVELRIIASSPQARELLAQELPKLRDSLLQQNLNLDKVEIGLNQGSAWSQSSRDGRSSQGQSQEFFQQSRTRGVGGRSGEVRSYRQVTQTSETRPNPLHNGSIQVRV